MIRIPSIFLTLSLLSFSPVSFTLLVPHRSTTASRPSPSLSVAVACSTPPSVAKHPAQFEAVSSVSDRSFLCLGEFLSFSRLGRSLVGGI
ncbi:unnamed protein product [Citrullus colocynthis]|uniref:Secreted protein n=1 Tax=Citrullus colocynthis TaxID=252529 RepID=A0ABP0YJ14_9ROSI